MHCLCGTNNRAPRLGIIAGECFTSSFGIISTSGVAEQGCGKSTAFDFGMGNPLDALTSKEERAIMKTNEYTKLR